MGQASWQVRGRAIAAPYMKDARKFLKKFVAERENADYIFIKARKLAKQIETSSMIAGTILSLSPKWRQGGSRCNRIYEFIGEIGGAVL